uniref:wall-associated receptor kinase 2-like n=1 Tax=Erigeron canadensis TaxID=72917 RepID=UPI001CB97496|nr:wall-associated receptor kinase 2-like [Erigeron canadensis]
MTLPQAKFIKLLQLFYYLISFLLFRFPNVTHSKPNCPAVDKCGNVTIPYPFSTVDGCYHDESYYIQCDPSTQIPLLNMSSYLFFDEMLFNGTIPRYYLTVNKTGNLEVLEITLDGHLIVAVPPVYSCFDKHGTRTSGYVGTVSTFKFPFSSTRNRFVGVGCDIDAVMLLEVPSMNTSCPTLCDYFHDIKNGSCQGSGCCTAPIPQGMTKAGFAISGTVNQSWVASDYSKCGYAFMVDHTKYNFSVGDPSTMSNDVSFPVVLEWFAGNTCCEKAKMDNTTYMCRGKSVCQDVDRERGLPGYRCQCYGGYSGNPYVSDGCQGSFDPLFSYSLGVAGKAVAGIFCVAIVMALTYCGIKKRKSIKGRENFFKQNGGIMLQEVLFSRKDQVDNNAIIFTYEELKKATNKFNKTNIIGHGGYGVVYKGILANKTTVAIKKSKVIDESQIKQFLNEVIILSKINHPNIVKLLGCCFETHVPLLVYEYITNNTLCHHIHKEATMNFETRLKIATETAKALYYMHSTTQIIHRDVKPSNILLNDEFSAKLSDFGISRFVPPGQSHLSTYVKGTIGYVDPEYFCTGKLNEKSDVYSFGVVLVELLTGTKIHSLEISLNRYRGAAAYLSSLLERNALFKVLDKQLKSEEYAEVVKRVAEIAIHCLDLEGKNRPTMKEVKKELEHLRCVLFLIKAKAIHSVVEVVRANINNALN